MKQHGDVTLPYGVAEKSAGLFFASLAKRDGDWIAT